MLKSKSRPSWTSPPERGQADAAAGKAATPGELLERDFLRRRLARQRQQGADGGGYSGERPFGMISRVHTNNTRD